MHLLPAFIMFVLGAALLIFPQLISTRSGGDSIGMFMSALFMFGFGLLGAIFMIGSLVFIVVRAVESQANDKVNLGLILVGIPALASSIIGLIRLEWNFENLRILALLFVLGLGCLINLASRLFGNKYVPQVKKQENSQNVR